MGSSDFTIRCIVVTVAALAGCSNEATSPDAGAVPGSGVVADGATGGVPDAAGRALVDAEVADGMGDASATEAPCAPSPQIHGNLKPVWSAAIGSGYGAAVATDSSNDIVVAGSALGPITVEGQTFQVAQAGAGDSPFLMKLDSSGKLLWHSVFKGEANVQAVAVDQSGHIFVVGDIGEFSTMPPDLGTGPLSGSFFLAKFDPQGHTLWVYSAACSDITHLGLAVGPTGAVVDGSGDVVVTGNAANPSCFTVSAGDASAGSGDSQGFVTTFDPNGHVKYSMAFSNDQSSVATFDPSGNLFLAGQFTGNLNLGSSATASGGSTAYVARIESTGVLWDVPDGTYSSVSGIASSAAGIVVAGTFSGTIGLAQTENAQGPNDIFLAGVGDGGVPTFEKSLRAAGLSITALAADPTGGVVAAGDLSAYNDLGDGLLAPPGVAIVKFDPSGNPVSSASFDVNPYTGLSVGKVTLAVDTGGNVVIGTAFNDAADFGTGILTSADSNPRDVTPTIVIARYAPGAPDLPSARAACPVVTDAGLPEGGTLLGTGIANGRALDIALSDDTVYWTTGTEVMAAPIAGGNATPLAITQNGAGPIVLDSNRLYWTNAGPYPASNQAPPATGSVVSLHLDGGAVTTLAPGQIAPGPLVLDATNVYYFAGGVPDGGVPDPDGGTSPVSILAVPRAGGTTTTIATGLASIGPLAISGGDLAFATSSGASPIGSGTTKSQIFTVPVTGGSPTMVATTDHGVVGVALDATNVYWLDSSSSFTDSTASDGRVRSASRTGGTTAILADHQAGPEKLVLLGSTLFWSNAGAGSVTRQATNGGLWSLPTSGGAPTALVAGIPGGVSAFAVESAHIAWFDLLDGESGTYGVFVKSR